MDEQWRPIPGYLGNYEVSNLGRIRSLDRLTDRGRRWRGRMMTPSSMPRGYKVVTLWRPGRQRTWLVHRVVLMAFVGDPTDGQEALHINGDNTDNRLCNLRWGTHSDNQFDQVAHGTHCHAKKTHCPVGHELNEQNTYHYPGKPHRQCRICRRNYMREYQRRARARARAQKGIAA